MVQAIPEGVANAVPYLSVRGAKKAVEFYKAAFGAEVMSLMPMGDELIGHADLKVHGSRIYLADEIPQWGQVKSPKTLGGTSVNIHLWVEDCDAVFAQAVAAGAKVSMPLTDQFWGDRYGMVTDPFGHVWAITTHKEDVSEEEMARRSEEATKQMALAAPKPDAKSKAKAKAKSKPDEPAKNDDKAKTKKVSKPEKPAKEDKSSVKAREKAARKIAKAEKKAHKKDKKRKKKSKH